MLQQILKLSITIMLGASFLPANAQNACTYSWLFPIEQWDVTKGEKHLDALQVRSPHEDTIILSGQASIIQDEKQLRASHIRYHRDTKRAYAFGHVMLQDPDYLGLSDTAEHDDLTKHTQLTDLTYQLRQNQAWGKADLADIAHDKEVITLQNPSYTGCPIGKEDWWLTFKELKVDDIDKLATGKHAVLEFHDIPVFYMPWFQFSTADRASGLLMPTIAAYSNETSTSNSIKSVVKIPYYFNIAPHLDDTLTIMQMADRGVVLDNEFRYWYPKQRGELTTSFLHDDTTSQDRYRVQWRATQFLPNNWGMSWDWHDVSDAAFYREIQMTDYYLRNMVYLPRSFSLNKGWDDHNVSFQLLDFKQLMYGQPYYSALPKISHQWRQANNSNPFYFAANSEFSHFLLPEGRQTAPVGNRLHLVPTAGFSLWQPYGFLQGKTQLHMTQYELTDNTQNSLSRVLPMTSLDAGLTFEKPLSLFNHGFIHTLEPRIKYLYIPKIDQSQFPVFDTMPRSFDYLQLFADNRFTGLDRIGDANQVTTGFFSRLLHETGEEFIEFGLGQISYFQSRVVQLPGTAEEYGDFSDLIGTVSLIQGNWRATLTQQMDRDTKQVIQDDISLQYMNDRHDRFIVRHRLRRKGTPTEDEQISLGGKIKYDGTWSSLHFVNYNNTSEQMRSAVHAVQYDNCCWGAQLIWEHNLYLNDVQSDIIRLAFIFKGLTTFGSTADDKIDSRLYFE